MMGKDMRLWTQAFDPVPLLADPHIPLGSTLIGIEDRLQAALNVIRTMSDDRHEEQEYGVAVARLAAGFTLMVLDHFGLEEGEAIPPIINVKMADLTVATLLARVQGHLRDWREATVYEEAHAPPNSRSPHKLDIDRNTFTVRYKDKSCQLGNTMPFRLLERLDRARGHYVSISSLIEDVWLEKDVSGEAVQRQASTLRAKLKEAGIEGIEIESQPGYYRLILR